MFNTILRFAIFVQKSVSLFENMNRIFQINLNQEIVFLLIKAVHQFPNKTRRELVCSFVFLFNELIKERILFFNNTFKVLERISD
jgi:hypothetical protein